MEVLIGVVIFVLFFVGVFLIAMIPAWLLLLAYNYLVTLTGHATMEVPVTFMSVVCIAFILAVLRSILGRGK